MSLSGGERLLTVSEAGVFLRVSRSMMYKLIEEKRLEHYRIHSKLLISKEQLERFLASCACGGAA